MAFTLVTQDTSTLSYRAQVIEKYYNRNRGACQNTPDFNKDNAAVAKLMGIVLSDNLSLLEGLDAKLKKETGTGLSVADFCEDFEFQGRPLLDAMIDRSLFLNLGSLIDILDANGEKFKASYWLTHDALAEIIVPAIDPTFINRTRTKLTSLEEHERQIAMAFLDPLMYEGGFEELEQGINQRIVSSGMQISELRKNIKETRQSCTSLTKSMYDTVMSDDVSALTLLSGQFSEEAEELNGDYKQLAQAEYKHLQLLELPEIIEPVRPKIVTEPRVTQSLTAREPEWR
ncbi:MAG: hypothetical protein HRU40_22290 [Saprospiraceae bacterium]|nr:hypothetical protein [Saprospiraceae bacterium]